MPDRYPARGLLGVFVLLVAMLTDPIPAMVGDSLPLEGLDGQRLEASSLEQGVTLLVVWASWSPRCRDVVSRLHRLAETWSDQAAVGSVVFQESPEQIEDFLAGKRLTTPVYFDRSGKFSKHHAVTTLPMLLVFRDGERIFRGRLSANPDPTIERALASSSEDARTGSTVPSGTVPSSTVPSSTSAGA